MNVNNLDVLTALSLVAPGAQTATVTGSAIDLQEMIGVLKVDQEVGAVSGATPTLNGAIQDSADGETFAAVNGLTFPQVTAATSLQTLAVDTRYVRRYIQYVGTITGTTPSFALSVRAVAAAKDIV